MRRGRATLPHPQPRRDDTGRILITRQHAAELGHRHIDHVRKLVPPVACDVRTRVVLLDLDDVEHALGRREHRNPARLQPLRPE